jgi:VIT1/CCC1 family predicted Fe2+/Mn2+ transporter
MSPTTRTKAKQRPTRPAPIRATPKPASKAPQAAPAPGPVTKADIARYRENLQGEIDAIALYSVLAEKETGTLKRFYERMVEVESVHAGVWRKRLEAAGVDSSRMRPAWQARVLMFVARHFGPSLVVPTIAEREAADEAMYDDQPEALARMPGDERSHARLFRELASGRGVEGGAIARIEGRHRGGGGNQLRAAVLGANDGLVSNLSISMGVAGASDAATHTVLIAGLAGMLAGALSMAIGEWLSVQSARELFARQVKVEREELLTVPDEEEEELTLIYQSKGLSADQARLMSKSLVTGELGRAVDTLAREELGIDPEELGGSAWVAAFTSFFLFALGAVVPIVPFIFASGVAAVAISVAVSAVALLVVGAAITVVTGGSVLRTGGRQVVLGLLAAAVTFGLGTLVGRAVG